MRSKKEGRKQKVVKEQKDSIQKNLNNKQNMNWIKQFNITGFLRESFDRTRERK